MSARVALLALTAVVLAGCTSGSGPGPSRSAAPPTRAATTHAASSTPTTAAKASSCPYARTRFVRATIGMRLGRLTVLRSGGRIVGCRFYALQGSPLHASEHLPGPHQPALEITTRSLASVTAARNAFVLLARKGKNPQRAQFGGGVVGVCFQTDFYARDHGTDFACAANKRNVEVVVRSVDTTGAFSTIAVTRTVLRNV